MAHFHTQNPNLGKILKVLQWKMFVHFMAIWSNVLPVGTLLPFGIHTLIIFGIHIFGMLYQKIWQPCILRTFRVNLDN
jgi:hypothetical protein